MTQPLSRSATVPSARVLVPERIGRYEVSRELGRGSMGSVYLAHDPNIGRDVALKILDPQMRGAGGDDEEFRKRFVLEARAAGRLNHPGIVTIYDAGIDEASALAFLAMEYVDGESLEEILRKCTEPLDVDQAADLTSALAKALDYAHTQGVVHRDVKPANVLIGRDGRVKILDFGIAKLTMEDHTIAGQVLGTPAYMSPEQAKGRPLDGRSDLFSLGSLLYRCVSGKEPFRGDSLVAIGFAIINEAPQPLRECVDADSLPEGFSDVLRRAMEKDPAERYASGRELAEALAPFRSSPNGSRISLGDLLPASVPPPPPLSPPKTPPAAGLQATSSRSFEFPSAPAKPTPVPPPFPTAVPDANGSDDEEVEGPWQAMSPRALLSLGAVVLALLLVVGMVARQPSVDATVEGVRELISSPEEAGDQAPPVDAIAEKPGVPIAPRGEQVGSGETVVVPGEGVDPSTSGEPLLTSTLVVRHENRLRSARMTIWIDGERAWSEKISAEGNLLERARGDRVEVEIPVSSGDHTVEVRITGAKKRVDAAEILRGGFAEGQRRLLRAKLVPGVDNLILEWE